MRIFKNKAFHKWAGKERIDDEALQNAVDEMERGLVDADFGGHVFKKCVAVGWRGKSSGCALFSRTGSVTKPSSCSASQRIHDPISVMMSWLR